MRFKEKTISTILAVLLILSVFIGCSSEGSSPELSAQEVTDYANNILAAIFEDIPSLSSKTGNWSAAGYTGTYTLSVSGSKWNLSVSSSDIGFTLSSDDVEDTSSTITVTIEGKEYTIKASDTIENIVIPSPSPDPGDDFNPTVSSVEELKEQLDTLNTADQLTIRLADGTYGMQIVIPEGKEVLIEGENENNTIITLADDEYNTDILQGFENVSGTQTGYGIIIAGSGAKLTIRNVTIQADPDKIDSTSKLPWQRFAAITTQDADLSVENVTIKNIKCSEADPANLLMMSTFGYGILTTDSASNKKNTINITDSEFKDFQKAAIYIATLGQTPSSDDVTISGNIITGWGEQDLIAQNGIWVNTEGDLDISKNTVSKLQYFGAYSSTGIAVDALYANDKEQAAAYKAELEENNTITDVDVHTLVEGEPTEVVISDETGLKSFLDGTTQGDIGIISSKLTINGTLPISVSDITLEGEGDAAEIVLADAVTQGENQSALYITGDNVSIENIKISVEENDTPKEEGKFAFILTASGNGLELKDVEFDLGGDVTAIIGGPNFYEAENVVLTNVTVSGISGKAPLNINKSTVTINSVNLGKGLFGTSSGTDLAYQIQVNANTGSSSLTVNDITTIEAIWVEPVTGANPSTVSIAGYSDMPSVTIGDTPDQAAIATFMGELNEAGFGEIEFNTTLLSGTLYATAEYITKAMASVQP